MGKQTIRNKKSTNLHQKKVMSEHVIDEMDLAFCDLVAAGWNERLAAYYAYGLSTDNDSSIDTFIKNQKSYHPGILSYQKQLDEERNEEARRLQKRSAEIEAQAMPTQHEEYDLRTKQGMLEYLIELSSTSGLDLKTRADLAKQISDLQNYKKEEVKIEDNRIHFYLPITCKYCNRCEKCRIKEYAEASGAKVHKSSNGITYEIQL